MLNRNPNSNRPIVFDTLSYANRLEGAGFTREQAEIQAETFFSMVQDQLASKRDLKEMDNDLKLRIETVRKELKVEIEQVRKDLSLEIEQVRKDLSLEIEQVRKEIEQVRKEIEQVRKDLSLEIAHLRKELKTDIELLRRDLKVWFGGMLVVLVTVMPALTTWLGHFTH